MALIQIFPPPCLALRMMSVNGTCLQERYFRCDGLLRRWALLDGANRRVETDQLTPEEAEEGRQLAEQAIEGVRELLDGEWQSKRRCR